MRVGIGSDRTHMPASLKLWDIVSQSDIAYGTFVQMRGRNRRTDNPPRVSFFILIVKSDIKIFVWSVDKSNDLHLACRGDHRSSEVVSVTKCTFVCDRYSCYVPIHLRSLP